MALSYLTYALNQYGRHMMLGISFGRRFMNGMNETLRKLRRILPKTIEDAYNGSPLAKHAFLVITMVTIAGSHPHSRGRRWSAVNSNHTP